MKLDRDVNYNGKGKYALIKLREIPDALYNQIKEMKAVSDSPGQLVSIPVETIELGDSDAEEFFVMKLKDQWAQQGLALYANMAYLDGDQEYAESVFALAEKSRTHPLKKKPD